jgi:hypothetical protein
MNMMVLARSRGNQCMVRNGERHTEKDNNKAVLTRGQPKGCHGLEGLNRASWRSGGACSNSWPNSLEVRPSNSIVNVSKCGHRVRSEPTTTQRRRHQSITSEKMNQLMLHLKDKSTL